MMFRLFAKIFGHEQTSTKPATQHGLPQIGEINKRQQQEENVLDLGFHDLVLKDLVMKKMVGKPGSDNYYNNGNNVK